MNQVAALTLGLYMLTAEPQVSEADLARFPPRPVVREELRFGELHIDWLTQQVATFPNEEDWQSWLSEAKARRHLWSLLMDEDDESSLPDNLRELRWRIGEEAYWSGVMPASVPVWRFQRCD